MSGPKLLAYNDLEGVYDSPERIGKLAGVIGERRDENTVVCGAGDDTALGTVALLSGDQRALARPFFERVEPAAETFGNHDFDLGRSWAFDWADSTPPVYCCANLTGPGVDRIDPSTVVERADRRIGVVGVAHPKTAEICGSISTLSFEDPVAAVRRESGRLRDSGVDYVVALSHCGTHDREIAAETDVDALVGGHVHRKQCEVVDETAFVRTSSGGHEIAEVQLGPTPSASIHEIDRDATVVDERLTAEYRRVRAETDVDEPVAEVDTRIDRSDAERFDGESRAGNFLAEAVRQTADADIALFPAGSLRDGPSLVGTVTVGDVVSLAPFDDPVREVVVSGSELREALDSAAEPRAGDRGWVHTHVSGCRVVWVGDGTLQSVSVGGEPVVDDSQYTVATTGWLVAVSERFDPISPESVTEKHEPIYRSAIECARAGGLTDAARTGRISKQD
jgi:2',3'-cyclic-nucleotide 2'-phosphodiesterase (5'-nucleotidase family)